MLKKIMIGLFLLVLVAVALIYSNYFFWKVINDRDAVKKVNEQHAAADIEGNQIFQSYVSSLQQLGIMGEKVAESKADTCYIDSASAGFTIRTWEQFCQLDYLAGYTALLPQEETFDRIEAASLRKEDRNFPQRRSWSGCSYGGSGSNGVTYVPTDSISKDDDCRIPDRVKWVGLFGAGRPGNTNFDYTFAPDTIDQSVDLVWITYTHRYYREDIGCLPLSLCSNPRSTPIQAD